MKPTEFSHHIGNIDDKLIHQAEDMPNFGRQHRVRNIRRTLLVAAVIALMTGSFIVGAVAINRGPETIYVEKEQEIIAVGNSGISLILPDWWKGKYEIKQDDKYVNVYHTATRERSEYGGMLFGVSFEEQIRPMDYLWPWPAFTIAITENGTYYLGQPSDVQFDLNDPVTSAEYQALSDDIKNIQIVMSTEMLENSINMSNAIKGTVFVYYVDENMQVMDSIICTTEQSRQLIEIINRQEYSYLYNYDEQLGKYWTDLRVMYDDEEYFISLTGKTIYGTNYGARYAHLSDEDVNTILDVLNYTPSGWQPNEPPSDPPPLSDDDKEIPG